MKKFAVIVAGGSGLRAGGDMPKQFQKLLGIPMLWWSVRAFRAEDPATNIVVVVHRDYLHSFDELVLSALPDEERLSVNLVEGGADRLASVSAGLRECLRLCEMDCEPDRVDRGEEFAIYVAVHDAARPMLTPDLIRRGWEAVRETGGAVPVVPVVDSLREVVDDKSRSVDRARFRAVQTPQVFDLRQLYSAYSDIPDSVRPGLTDDASVAEMAGIGITLFPGCPVNMKVTGPQDFALAETLLKCQNS